MTRFIYSIAILFISIIPITSQNNTDAERIISNFLAAVKTDAIKTNFKLDITEKNAVNSHSISGTFTLKGNKFFLEVDDMKVWFDGKTQWAYVPQSNEVSITEPTDAELAETNPLAILSAYQTKCNIQFGKNKTTKFSMIVMTPKQKNTDISKIEIQINKTSNELYSIKLYQKNASTTALTLTNYQKGINIGNDTFVFNKTKFKNLLINDLR